VTSEIMMLAAFVLFDAVLSSIIDTASLVPAMILAALLIFVIRSVVINLMLVKAKMSWEARAFSAISWFGPRGLNPLLLALPMIQAAIPGAKLLLAIVGIVAIASVIIHGASASPINAWYGYKAAEETLVEARESTALGLFRPHDGQVPRLSPEDLHHMLESEAPPIYWTSALDLRINITKGRFQAAYESCPMRL